MPKILRLHRVFLVFLLVICPYLHAQPKTIILLESPSQLDLKAWAHLWCPVSQSSQSEIHLADLQKSGLYLANLSIQLLTAPPGQDLSDLRALESNARQQMRQLKHLGMAWGLCPSPLLATGSMAWVVTSAAPLLLSEENVFPPLMPAQISSPKPAQISVQLHQQGQEHCRSLEAWRLTGDQHQAEPVSLTSALAQSKKPNSNAKADSVPPTAGRTGIYCFPKSTKYGPNLWAVIPEAGFRHDRFPAPAEGALNSSNLLRWINQIRQASGLNAVEVGDKNLIKIVSDHQHQEGIQHLRDQLQQLRKKLLQTGYVLVGENRFAPQSLAEVAYLLWLSPRHHSLIYDAKVDLIVILPSDSSNVSWVLVGLQKRVWDQSWRKSPPDLVQKAKASSAVKTVR